MSERQNNEEQPRNDEKGTKDNRPTVDQVVSRIDSLREETQAETMKSSFQRAQESGNPHPVAPEDRLPDSGPQNRAAIDAAAGHLEAARTAALTQDETEKRLKSDPRYERDQKVFELARTGAIANVPPSEAEIAAQNINLPEEVREAIPSSAAEQVDEDMQRIQEAERKQEAIRSGAVVNTNVGGDANKSVPAADTTKKDDGEQKKGEETGGVKKFGV